MNEQNSTQWMVALVAIVGVVAIVTLAMSGRSAAPATQFSPEVSLPAAPSQTLGGQAFGTECTFSDDQINCYSAGCMTTYFTDGDVISNCFGKEGSSDCWRKGYDGEWTCTQNPY